MGEDISLIKAPIPIQNNFQMVGMKETNLRTLDLLTALKSYQKIYLDKFKIQDDVLTWPKDTIALILRSLEKADKKNNIAHAPYDAE